MRIGVGIDDQFLGESELRQQVSGYWYRNIRPDFHPSQLK
jgi:hypothetical protein